MQQQEDDAELTRRTNAVDGKSMAADSYTRLLSVLAAGDAAVFVLFAAIGRGSHDTDTGNALTTAAPFLAAWAALAPPLGAYPARASRSNEQAAKAPLVAWLVAVPCGCALRGLLQGRVPAAPFWLIALIATLGLLEAWRLSYYQVSSLNRAVNQFAAAIVDEDDGGGDDDY